MSVRAWSDIVAAYEDISRIIDAALGDRVRSADLPALRARIRRRLDALHATLAPPLSDEQALNALVPLVFLLDEQIQGRLARAGEGDPPAWPLLQRDMFPDGDGGDVFYEQAEALLRAPEPDQLLIGVYLICLQAGFEGRLIDEPAAIPQWKARLAEKLPTPPPTPGPTDAPSTKTRPLWHYALITVGALLVWQLVLFAIARAL